MMLTILLNQGFQIKLITKIFSLMIFEQTKIVHLLSVIFKMILIRVRIEVNSPINLSNSFHYLTRLTLIKIEGCKSELSLIFAAKYEINFTINFCYQKSSKSIHNHRIPCRSMLSPIHIVF